MAVGWREHRLLSGREERALCLAECGTGPCVSLWGLDLYFLMFRVRLVWEVLVCIPEFNPLFPIRLNCAGWRRRPVLTYVLVGLIRTTDISLYTL